MSQEAGGRHSPALFMNTGAPASFSLLFTPELCTRGLLAADQALECGRSASAAVTDLTIPRWPFDLTPRTLSTAWVTFYPY